jgi:hypothetical protein
MTVNELLDLLLRWFHVIAGIMWIGNSLLFNWLDRNLVKKEGIDGEIWLLHSGAFYQIEKKLLEPHQMPPKVHWFMWQNFSTWASGILLLVVVYYLGEPSPSARCSAAGSSTISCGARRSGTARSWPARCRSRRWSQSPGRSASS